MSPGIAEPSQRTAPSRIPVPLLCCCCTWLLLNCFLPLSSNILTYRLFRFLPISLRERKFGLRRGVIRKDHLRMWWCLFQTGSCVNAAPYNAEVKASTSGTMRETFLCPLGRAVDGFPASPCNPVLQPGKLRGRVVLPLPWQPCRDWPCHSAAICWNQIIKLSSHSELICHSLSVLELTWSVIYFPRQWQCRYTMLIHFSGAQQGGWEKCKNT